MATTETDLPDTGATPDRLPLTRRELALIVAFWAGYALLAIANRFVDAGGPGTRGGSVVLATVQSLCWALLTPPVFRLAAAAGSDGERGGGRRRAAWLAAIAVVGLLVALGMGWLNTELRGAFMPPRGSGGRPPPPGGPPRHGGPPIWFEALNALVLFLGVLAAGLARAYSLRYRARREQTARLQAQLAEARLDALRRQLDPHFLFNTLHAVSSLVERDPRGVRRMIARLSELLRHSIEGEDEPEVPLRRELALLDRYVDIMRVRFQGRLAVETNVGAGALDALVPAMILQPLVENAIRHGVEKLTGPGRIAIDAAVEGGALVLRVWDNGPYVPRDEGAPGGGVGLRNTVARLEQLYGARQRFTLGPDERGDGTVAEVRLPYRARPEVPVASTDAASAAVTRA